MTNVLIVDDEKIEREGLKYLLSREEGERKVFEASNGKQALQIIRTEDIQLILTDIKMPHMDGLELSRRAKEENPALQIVIFSGYSDFSFAQEAIRYGVTEYILKPVNPEDFHKVIQKAEKEIDRRKKKESQEIKGKNFLQQYFPGTWKSSLQYGHIHCKTVSDPAPGSIPVSTVRQCQSGMVGIPDRRTGICVCNCIFLNEDQPHDRK